jgi:small subunit ribosomal protein S5
MPKPNNNKRGRFQKREPKEFEEEVIQIDRVTKVVKGGRRLRFRATVAIGNRKGKIGIGLGKSNEVTGAIQKAIAKAKKSLISVNLDETTVPHDLKIKFKSAKIIFLPASPGTGIIAGGSIRKVLTLAGVKDILSKSYGTTNKVNNTRATYEALKLFKVTPLMEKKAKASGEAKRSHPKKSEEKTEVKDSTKPNVKENKPAEAKKPETPKPAPTTSTPEAKEKTSK